MTRNVTQFEMRIDKHILAFAISAAADDAMLVLLAAMGIIKMFFIEFHQNIFCLSLFLETKIPEIQN